MKWVLLIIAGFSRRDLLLVLGKAQSVSGRESLLWWLGFVICLFSSMYLMFRAISGVGAIPIGTAYAVWTGIGAVGGVVMGILVFNDPLSFWRIFFIITLIASVVGLKWVSN